jgi:hypothetical protein
MGKKPTPARAKKLDTSVPMRGRSVGIEPPKTGRPLPATPKAGPAKATSKDAALQKIRQKYGEDEYHRALDEYQKTFRGEQRTNSEIRNKDNSHAK